jgi:hypothetical protein
MRIFISCVSKEFRSYRDALRQLVTTAGLDAKVQEDFTDGGGTLLEKLDDYVQRCQAIIHLVGQGAGARPTTAEVRAILKRHPALPQDLPELALPLAPNECLFTYTQWEVYLAIYHGVSRYIYLAQPGSRREPDWRETPSETTAQQQHIDRLRALGEDRYIFPFDDPRDVALRFLRSYVDQLTPEARSNSTKARAPPDIPTLKLPSSLNISGLSRALEPALASIIWSRLQAGERGFLKRAVYNDAGRILFDEVRRRCQTDPSFLQAVDSFLQQFEAAIQAYQRSQGTSEEIHALQTSDAGRAYLLIAHAAQRIS